MEPGVPTDSSTYRPLTCDGAFTAGTTERSPQGLSPQRVLSTENQVDRLAGPGSWPDQDNLTFAPCEHGAS